MVPTKGAGGYLRGQGGLLLRGPGGCFYGSWRVATMWAGGLLLWGPRGLIYREGLRFFFNGGR